jgi:hypothetical protein
MSYTVTGGNLEESLNMARKALMQLGVEVSTDTWQGTPSPFGFIELLNLSVDARMAHTEEEAFRLTGSTPWAREHFGERVSGMPLNPPPSHVKWAKGTDQYLSKIDAERFSHTYPERLWAKGTPARGIRYDIADLSTAAALLRKDPTTRQCYVPLYFPEDLTAAMLGERVPCTFGWHFILRDEMLHCHYPMRSVDAVRHVHHDWYFANMLTLWLIEKAVPGHLFFNATSFHCFTNDGYALGRLVKP